MNKFLLCAAAAAMAAAMPATAQTDTGTAAPPASTRGQDRLNNIFGALFGTRGGSTDSIEAQWSAGRTPLATQRSQFESRIDADTRSGAIAAATGTRLKSDYAELVSLEARYGADGRFTTAERTELADRYGNLTQVLADGRYGSGSSPAAGDDGAAVVADGRDDFNRRVDAAVAARRISRVESTRLKSDYAALVTAETGYLRDGRISASERGDLDARLDALDARVDGTGAAASTPRARLDAIARALPASGLTTAAQAQLRTEHGDLLRLDAAYAQGTPSSDDRAYLDRRIGDLEARARVRR